MNENVNVHDNPSGDDPSEAKFLLMTQAPVESLICRMAIPTIATMLISALYNMADTYFVGSLGTSATGGVGVVFSLMAIIQALGFFFGHGSGNYISRALGAHHMEQASRMAATGFLSSLLSGGIVAALGLSRLEPLARFLGATDTILPYACDYLFYILIGAPWMTASLMLNNLLRFQGSAFYGMIGMISGAVLNVVLDPIFIFIFGMGVAGASLATMLSQFVTFCLLLAGSSRGGSVRINVLHFSPRFAVYREIVRGGLPSLFRQGVASVGTLFLNRVAGNFGDAAIAAISIVQRVTIMANSALIGFGQGFQPVCGFNYGARRYGRVTRGFWFCVRVSTVFLIGIAATGFVTAPWVISQFRRDDAAVIGIGALALRMQCMSFPLTGWVVLCNMMLQTIGKSVRASVLALGRQGLFLLSFLFLLTPPFKLLGLQMSQPAADVVTFLLAVPLTAGVLREMAESEDVAAGPD
ncbi:MAG: MATE family efflux transporter [Synergistaceae bacterium]|nr:MATE family efflux transporter [Synergistaceae bacterium]